MELKLADLQQMQNVDIRTVDQQTAIDIKNTKIDCKKTLKDKLNELIQDGKNPYIYKCDDYTIQFKFSETERSIEDCFEEYISTLT